ncbi:hypothetical protein Mapa_002200 [Marchantia paleacea]|nr:hypothetical protein Mapa_002200 [Marchantia paleacea]
MNNTWSKHQDLNIVSEDSCFLSLALYMLNFLKVESSRYPTRIWQRVQSSSFGATWKTLATSRCEEQSRGQSYTSRSMVILAAGLETPAHEAVL